MVLYLPFFVFVFDFFTSFSSLTVENCSIKIRINYANKIYEPQ